MRPDYAEAWSNKGATLNQLKRYEEALTHYDRAIGLKPDYADALMNKGSTLNELKRYEEALINYDRAIALKPDYAVAWMNKGIALNELKLHEEALIHYDKAIELRRDYPEAYFNRAVINLYLKRFISGWADYDARFKNKEMSSFKYPLNIKTAPIWDGNQFCKNLFVISEQGIGDEIFYLSNLASLMPKVQKITVCLDKRLAQIFERSFPSVTFIGKDSPIDMNLYDAQIALGSLPKVLNVDPTKDLLRYNPYLIDNLNLSKEIKNSLSFKNKFTCGISWKSSNNNIGSHKSINLTKLMNILNGSDCEFVNLQYGDVLQDIKNTEEATGVKVNTITNIDIFNDIDGLLSIINACDVVITTSNVTAHLSGAIGKKTFLLLPYSKGRIWYWHEEEVSSWYPTIKQYFQDSDFSWDSAIAKIALELKIEIDRSK